MEHIGHQLLATRIDEQFLDIISAQLLQATSKVCTDCGLDSVWADSLQGEFKALIEAAYYMLSLSTALSSKIINDASGNSDSIETVLGTPGMQAVGISVDTSLTSTLSSNPLGGMGSIISYIALKWSFAKLQRMSISEGTQFICLLVDLSFGCRSSLFTEILLISYSLCLYFKITHCLQGGREAQW